MVRLVREYVGFIALHAQQSWAERNQEEIEVLGDSWVACVTFHGGTRDPLHHQLPTLRYVNLRRGFLWPTHMHLCTFGRLHTVAKQLTSQESAHRAFHLFHDEVRKFCCHSYESLLSSMSTGMWMLMVAKCYESLTYVGSASHEAALVILVQPVTCVLSFLCNADLQNVCWRLDWPSNYF